MPRKLCPKCHGQRMILCLACHGSGKKIPVGNCKECGGTGRVYAMFVVVRAKSNVSPPHSKSHYRRQPDCKAILKRRMEL
jgi:RecJ-like exonuclease